MKMFHSQQFLCTVILKISKIILFVTLALHKIFYPPNTEIYSKMIKKIITIVIKLKLDIIYFQFLFFLLFLTHTVLDCYCIISLVLAVMPGRQELHNIFFFASIIYATYLSCVCLSKCTPSICGLLVWGCTVFSRLATKHHTCHCNLQGQHSGFNYPLAYDLGLGHKLQTSHHNNLWSVAKIELVTITMC